MRYLPTFLGAAFVAATSSTSPALAEDFSVVNREAKECRTVVIHLGGKLGFNLDKIAETVSKLPPEEAVVIEQGEPNSSSGLVDTTMQYLEAVASDVGTAIVEKMQKVKVGGSPGVIRGFNPTPVPNIDNIAASIAGATGSGIRGVSPFKNINRTNPKLPDDGTTDQLPN